MNGHFGVWPFSLSLKLLAWGSKHKIKETLVLLCIFVDEGNRLRISCLVICMKSWTLYLSGFEIYLCFRFLQNATKYKAHHVHPVCQCQSLLCICNPVCQSLICIYTFVFVFAKCHQIQSSLCASSLPIFNLHMQSHGNLGKSVCWVDYKRSYKKHLNLISSSSLSYIT